jgi:HlyD family secretion protein
MKRTSLLIVIGVVAVTVSLAAYYGRSGEDGSPRFSTTEVTRGSVVATIEATGSLEAVETVEVSTQVSGTVESLHADFNSLVNAGQVVARLEPSLLQAQVEQAHASLVRMQADVERAEVTLEDARIQQRRARELWDQQLISQNDVETAESNLRQAEVSLKSVRAQLAQGEASLHQSRVNLSHTIIRTPIDGVVLSRSVEVGQTVSASTSAPTLFVIAKDLSRMRVNASISESDIGRIAPGQRVVFTVDAYPGDRFPGTVSQVRLEPIVESNVVSYVTIIDVPNPDQKLKPGMTATVSVEIARADDTVYVPNAALRFQPPAQAGEGGPAARPAEETRVWVLRDGTPHPVPVQTGLSSDTTTAIVAGSLREQDRVITGAGTGNAAVDSSSPSPFMPFGGGRGGRR